MIDSSPFKYIINIAYDVGMCVQRVSFKSHDLLFDVIVNVMDLMKKKLL